MNDPNRTAPESDDRAKTRSTRRRVRKERVLHTRIPSVLEDELKAAADGLRVPVSNLVRTILEDALDAADRATERVEDGLERAARTMSVERSRIADRVEEGLQRAAQTVHDEREKITGEVERGLRRAADTVQNEGERLADQVEEKLNRAASTMRTGSERVGDRVEDGLEDVADRVHDVVAPKADSADRGDDVLAGVYAFQPVIAAVAARCAKCDLSLSPGDKAALGLSNDPTSRIFVCEDCLPGKRPKD